MIDVNEPRAEMDEISSLRDRADNKRDNWLRERGWKYTSDTPGCYWMWMGQWEGLTLLVDADTAERIQRSWDGEADARLHPERYED